MSIDELSNNQDLRRRDLIASADVQNDVVHRDNPRHYRKQSIVPVSEPVVSGVSHPSLSSQELKALHRVRVNRILMRKRRQARVGKDMVPRIMTVGVIIVALLTLLVSGSAGAGYAYYQAQLPLLNGIAQHSLFQTTRIYDRNGTLLFELYDHQQDKGRRTYVNYSDISQFLVNATIAAEDRTFWTNNGVDFNGILRAAFSNAQSNQVVEGGSTVTQQLIKKEFFDGQPRTVQLKAEEALLATGLTEQYPKWKIMEMYLNTVYYGDLNYSAEAAAEDYFGLQQKCTRTGCKPAVAQLDLGQASMLAGLPQGPSLYNPIVNKPMALARQKVVLNGMLAMGTITQQQATQAEQEMAKYTFTSHSVNNSSLAPHFVQYVIDDVLVPLLGAQNLADGGYSVYTTLDLTLEKKVEQIVYDHLYKPTYDPYLPYDQYGSLYQTHNVNNGAAVVMNPYNGEILAMDGSARYDMNTPVVRGQDNAALGMRQPGSSFKPIVYATDFEMGLYPAMILPDHKTYYPYLMPDGTYYSPQNYDGTFHTGYPMTIRTAVANSYNIPAVDGIMYAGIGNVQNMAARLGLSEIANLKPGEMGASMAIGGNAVSLLDMTGAYATFANKGMHVPPTSILEITNNEGQPIYKYDEAHPKGLRALGEDVSFLISSILSDKTARYHEFSPGNPLELDRPAAAKTGTTDSFRDNWTMGYTPYLTVGTWAGNSDNSIMKGAIGITGAAPIWHDIMEYASERYHFPPDDFTRPANVHAGTVSAMTGLLPHPGEPTVTDWFIDGTMPTMMSTYVPDNNPQKNCNRRHICIQLPFPINLFG